MCLYLPCACCVYRLFCVSFVPSVSTLSVPFFPLRCFCLCRLSLSYHLFFQSTSLSPLSLRLYILHIQLRESKKFIAWKKKELSKEVDSVVKWHWNSTYFLDISLSFSPSAFSHSSFVWKQERALFEQYYACPLWLWPCFGHQSVPPLADRIEKALLQSTCKEQTNPRK